MSDPKVFHFTTQSGKDAEFVKHSPSFTEPGLHGAKHKARRYLNEGHAFNVRLVADDGEVAFDALADRADADAKAKADADAKAKADADAKAKADADAKAAPAAS